MCTYMAYYYYDSFFPIPNILTVRGEGVNVSHLLYLLLYISFFSFLLYIFVNVPALFLLTTSEQSIFLGSEFKYCLKRDSTLLIFFYQLPLSYDSSIPHYLLLHPTLPPASHPPPTLIIPPSHTLSLTCGVLPKSDIPIVVYY